MPLLSEVTIVIPTHYRHKYLTRLLRYYDGMNIQILVADSTNIEYKDRNKFDIKYVHYLDTTLLEKLVDIVNQVKTKYMLFCADDDFWIKESISPCINFLENNSEYSSIQGKYIQFQKRDNKIDFTPAYLHGTSIEHKTIAQRLNTDFNNYMPLFYSIHKTEIIQRVFFDNYKTNINHAILIELSVNCYSLVFGKYKTLDILTYVRDLGSISSDVDRDELSSIAHSEKFKNQYLQFKQNISLLISEKDTQLDSNEIINNALELKIGKENTESLKGKLLKFIYSILPILLNIRKRYKKKKVLSFCKNLKGYPLSDKKVISSWKEIKDIIEKC